LPLWGWRELHVKEEVKQEAQQPGAYWQKPSAETEAFTTVKVRTN